VRQILAQKVKGQN